MAAKLREGFTTGSAATGAALAALHLLRFGHAPDHVDVPLPPFAAQTPPEPLHSLVAGTQTLHARGWLRLAVATCAPGPAPELVELPELAKFSASLPPDTAAIADASDAATNAATADATSAGTDAATAAARAPLRLAHASIRKDGGDDPDATSGALITATVILEGPQLAGACAPEAAETTHNPASPAQMAGLGQESGSGPAQLPALGQPPTLGQKTQAASAAQAAPADFVLLSTPTAVAMRTDVDIQIEGGFGVGRVTLPGLPVPVGQAAINPVPRQQIDFALRHALASALPPCPRLRVIISVPEGERLARQTFNPRLGIVGGISILGTQGTVRPYSHQAWKATIQQGLAVAAATGCRSIGLTTGRRSERLLMERYPDMPPQSFVQVADFAAFSLQAAGAGKFDTLVWGCFFGKLVKLAQGHAYTHARHADLDMAGLARVCEQNGARCAEQVKNCVTAAHALELLLQDRAGTDVMQQVAVKAAAVAANFAGRPVRLHLFHTDGRELLAL